MSVATDGAAADDWLRHHVCSATSLHKVKTLGVAVSGGGDSMALLHLLADCASHLGITLEAATVDHGLRPEAAAEAAFVAETCHALGLAHETLHWRGWDGSGNLQAEARAARYRLLAGWARDRRLDAVALAHTLDDQAETFLMRLARAAGVDGLAAMDRAFERAGARFIRPALPLERAELRAYLTRHGHSWREDPSNDDPAFDRVKMRRALVLLEDLDIGKTALWEVANNLASASRALKHCTAQTARKIARVEAGDVVFDRSGLAANPYEIRRRLLSAALVWVSGSAYPPRREALFELDRAILAARAHTLNGCLVSVDRASVRIAREFNAVKDLVAAAGRPWDARWQVSGPRKGVTIRALGEAGLAQCPDWRETGLPRSSLLASPAVYDGASLVAAPLARREPAWTATLVPSRGDFFASILTH